MTLPRDLHRHPNSKNNSIAVDPTPQNGLPQTGCSLASSGLRVLSPWLALRPFPPVRAEALPPLRRNVIPLALRTRSVPPGRRRAAVHDAPGSAAAQSPLRRLAGCSQAEIEDQRTR